MPLIGPSVDRRSLAYVHQVCQSKNVEALMCFTCGQIHTHVACWDRLWQGSSDSRSAIRFYKVKDSLFPLLIPKPWESAEEAAHARQVYNKNLLKAEFIDRFASAQNGTDDPWHNASELGDNDTEWQRSLRVGGILFGKKLPDRTDRVICCPEDAKPCSTCALTPDVRCGSCEVALCSDCT